LTARSALRLPYHLISDIVKTVDGSDHGRLVMGDLDFLGMSDLVGRQTTFWKPYVERLDAFLHDTSQGHEARILAHLNERIVHGHHPADMLIDPITRAFVEERGCSVAALALLHRMAPEVDVVECHAPDETIAVTTWRATVTSPWQLSVAIRLGDGDATWRPNGIDYLDLPETLSSCVSGMPLSQVVSHPLLDGHRAFVVSHGMLGLRVRTSPPTRIYPEAP
jgi:hypothetical protein